MQHRFAASLQVRESKRSLFLEAESAFKSMSKLKEKRRHVLSESKKESELDDVIGARFLTKREIF